MSRININSKGKKHYILEANKDWLGQRLTAENNSSKLNSGK